MYTKFLKKTFVLLCVISTIITLYLLIYKNQIGRIKVNKNIKVIVCGDSHTQCAINDSLLKHTLNISQNSEPYLATYNVIRTITYTNPQIKTVILGYSYHSLSEVFDEIVYQEKHKVDFYSRYLPILDIESITLIGSHNFTGIIKSFPKSLNFWITLRNLTNSNSINYNNYRFFGEYYSSKKSNCNSKTIKSSINRHYYNGKSVKRFSNIQQKYLLKIIHYCFKNKLKIILLNTPISNKYHEKIPNKFKKKYYYTIRALEKIAPLIDLHDLQLKNEYFGDGDHINIYGAQVLKSKLDSIITKDYKIQL